MPTAALDRHGRLCRPRDDGGGIGRRGDVGASSRGAAGAGRMRAWLFPSVRDCRGLPGAARSAAHGRNGTARSWAGSLLRCVLLVALAVTCLPATAAGAGGIRIEEPWARATPPGTPMGAAYLVIVNTGDQPDRLLGASTPVAGRTQLHRSVEIDGESRMRHQAQGVPVPAGGTVRFAPQGYHVMLMGLERRLEAGGRVPLTLAFERAGRIELEVPVRALYWLPGG